MRYQWKVLQEGALPLRPSGGIQASCEHRCTSVLIWPETGAPSRENTILTDPCFTDAGLASAYDALRSVGISFSDIGGTFVTHARHGDHEPRLPDEAGHLRRARLRGPMPLPGMQAVPCPGHTFDLHALSFRSPRDESIWIVGDAILDLEWLTAWRYYWPNGYDDEEIILTWHSVALILTHASLVIPGHGPPIPVTRELVARLGEGFSSAECAERCGAVADALRRRLEALE